MEKVILGTTGAEVSALCLGTDYYGNRTSVDTAHQLLDQFYGAGGTFLDTANLYARWIPGFKGGESETTIGQWLQKRQNRSEMFIGTKVGGSYQDIPLGLKSKNIEAECEKSLRRLGIETIDLYYAHIDDRDTPHEETLEAFDRLVQAGKVRFIGVCNHLAWRIAEARTKSQLNNWASYCVVQQRYTYLRPKPGSNFGLQVAANNDLIDYCKEYGISFLAYSILLNGAYTRVDRTIPEQYNSPENEARLKVLKSIADEVDATPNQVIIAWLRQSDPPVIPIIGGSKREQLSENIAALGVKLSKDQISRLNEVGS